MKIFLYDANNHLNHLFRKPSYLIPFLNGTTLDFIKAFSNRTSLLLGETVTVMTPALWEEDNPYDKAPMDYLSEEYEILLAMSVNTMPVGNLSKDDITFLKQNPDRMFSCNGILGGFVKKGTEVRDGEGEVSLFQDFVSLDIHNFLDVNSFLVQQLSNSGVLSPHESVRTFGAPVILSDSVENSTICGPCFIGKEVIVENSYIGPGTVLVGSTSVVDSEVFSSFVDSASIMGVKKAEDMLAGQGSRVFNTSLPKGSVLPSGTILG